MAPTLLVGKSLKNTFLECIIILLLLSSSFLTLDIFTESKILPKWYAFMLVIFVGSVLSIFWGKKTIVIDKILLALILLLSYVLCRDLINEMPTIEIPLVISFLALCILFANIQFKWMNFNSAIIIICLVQALYGILQFSNILSIDDHKIIGSYKNPAGLAINLAISFPLIFLFIKSNKYFSITAAITIMVAVVLSGSRAGLLSILITCVIYVYEQFPPKLVRHKKLIVLATVISMLSVGSFLFFFKQNSAIGRVLVWQVSGHLIGANLIFGGGNYAFSTKYMEYQSEHFSQNSNKKYEQLADNIPHPYNEYILIIVKYGIVGLLILVVALILTFKSGKLSSPYILCLVSLCVFALFSYPLQYPVVWVIAAYCIVQIGSNNRAIFCIRSPKIALISVLSIGMFFLVKDMKFEYEWSKIYKMSLSGKTREVLCKYENLYNQWNGNIFFLYNYAAELNQLERYNKSVQVMKRCNKYYNDYDTQIMLADNYFGLENWSLAKKAYTQALNMCPNRFLPLFGLHKVGIELKNYKEATYFANEILEKEVKIPSPTVSFIKQSMKKYLKNKDTIVDTLH